MSEPFQDLVDSFLHKGGRYRVEKGGAALAEGVLEQVSRQNHILHLRVGGSRVTLTHPFAFSGDGGRLSLDYSPSSLHLPAAMLDGMIPQREEPYPFAAGLGESVTLRKLD